MMRLTEHVSFAELRYCFLGSGSIRFINVLCEAEERENLKFGAIRTPEFAHDSKLCEILTAKSIDVLFCKKQEIAKWGACWTQLLSQAA